MATIKVGGLSLEVGKGYRIIDEAELRQRVKLLNDGKSKYLEAIRRYGGKKLKVYSYDLVENRVWMSANKNDTFKWKPFMLADYVEERDKPIIDRQREALESKNTQTVSGKLPNVSLARNDENCGEVMSGDVLDRMRNPYQNDSRKKLIKMMFLMAMFQNMNQPQVEPAKAEKAKGK